MKTLSPEAWSKVYFIMVLIGLVLAFWFATRDYDHGYADYRDLQNTLPEATQEEVNEALSHLPPIRK